MRDHLAPVLLVALITGGCAGAQVAGSAPLPTSAIASRAQTQPPGQANTPSPTPGIPLFRPAVHLAAPIGPVVVGDFDTDGNIDIAGVKEDGTVSLVLGTGGGEFAPGKDLAGGDGPPSIAAADLNGDGRLDIVLTHAGITDRGNGADDIVVLLANADGTYKRVAQPAGVNPEAVVVEDFNRDGKPDLGTANNGDHVSIFLGLGDGTFRDPENYPTGAPFSSGIAASDFNLDGNLDVVTTNSLVGQGRSDRTISIVLGLGDGTFETPVVYDIGGPQPTMPVVDDFNGDDAPDVAMPDGYPTKDVSILLNRGDGTFSASVEYATGPNPHTLVAADLDEDGNADLVAGNLGEQGGPVGKGVAILFGRGDGTFDPEVDLSGSDLGEQIGAAADLDSDGTTDLIVPGNYELLLHFNTGVH